MRLLGLPRLVRILIAACIALAVTLVIALVVFYASTFYPSEVLMILWVIATAFGLATYMAGWQLIVGTVGETLPARPAIVWYMGIGILAVILILLWGIQAAITGAG